MKTKISEQQAIENLTRQTDYRGLCAHLIAAVNSLTGSKTTLFEAHDEAGRKHLEQLDLNSVVFRKFPDNENLASPGWLEDATQFSNRQMAPQYFALQDTQRTLFCIGNLNGVWRFLLIEATVTEELKATLKYILTIFQNLLGLLDRFERDALTGLLNRQSFDYRFEDLLEHQQRNPNRTQLDDAMPWLAIIDIDRFKEINDTHGHLFGDEILLLTARLIQECFRFDDLIFRYGGEEFIVILNNTNADGAELALERFRERIASYEFPTVGSVTVSIGWSCVMPQVPANSIIHRADRALYSAKSAGRNQTVSFEKTFNDEQTEDGSGIEIF